MPHLSKGGIRTIHHRNGSADGAAGGYGERIAENDAVVKATDLSAGEDTQLARELVRLVNRGLRKHRHIHGHDGADAGLAEARQTVGDGQATTKNQRLTRLAEFVFQESIVEKGDQLSVARIVGEVIKVVQPVLKIKEDMIRQLTIELKAGSSQADIERRGGWLAHDERSRIAFVLAKPELVEEGELDVVRS